MQKIEIPNGTMVLIGAPAKPVSHEILEALGNMVANFPEIIEAHLSQCFAIGLMKAPTQVLVLIAESKSNKNDTFRKIMGRLPDILLDGMELDIWPIQMNSGFTPMIRDAKCQIYQRPQ